MTPLIDAARADALVESGYPHRQAANIVGLPASTVYDIIKRHGHWGETAEQSVFKRYRTEQKAALEAGSRTLAAKLLVHADENYQKMSAYQAVGMYGILRQHERLDAGEPTSIQASVSIQAITSLDKLAAMLSSSLVESNPVSVDQTIQVVDITPEST